MAFNDFEISIICDEICEIYPNKDKLFSGRKAIKVLLRTNPNIQQKKFLDVFKIYRMETLGEDPQYIYQLNNFINNDHWKDIYEAYESLDEYRTRLQEKEDWCRSLIGDWNEACKSHWIRVSFPEPRIPLAKKAYDDPIFKEHWEKALASAQAVFEKPFPESDSRSRILPSFRWFTTLGDKHTVAKLIEGEYGKPLTKGAAHLYPAYRERVITPEEKQKEQERLNEDWKAIFGRELRKK